LAGTSEQVLTVADIGRTTLTNLFDRYGLAIEIVARDAPIPGSYWGEPEAGLVGSHLFVRNDTPIHSCLHESCHFICMPDSRRRLLDTNAGGDDLEEAAVCYLQIVLADLIPGVGRERLMQDMDAWGYSFRLGNTLAWFTHDADDARSWLVERSILAESGEATFRLRAGE